MTKDFDYLNLKKLLTIDQWHPHTMHFLESRIELDFKEFLRFYIFFKFFSTLDFEETTF